MRLGAIHGSIIPKKWVQIGLKLKRGPSTQEGHLALLECWLAHGKCQLAQMLDPTQKLPD